MSVAMHFPGLTDSRYKRLRCTSKENKERLVTYRVKKTLVDLEADPAPMRWNAFNRVQKLRQWLDRQ